MNFCLHKANSLILVNTRLAYYPIVAQFRVCLTSYGAIHKASCSAVTFNVDIE